VQIALKTPWDFFGSAGFLAFGELFSRKISGSNYFDRKLRQTRHFNGGKDSKKTLKMLALAHYES
jgi:hypothetical protein